MLEKQQACEDASEYALMLVAEQQYHSCNWQWRMRLKYAL